MGPAKNKASGKTWRAEIGEDALALWKILSLHFCVRECATGELDLHWLPDFRQTSFGNDVTVLQAIEHPVNESGLTLPDRRDMFVAGAPGRSNLDLSEFEMPDYHRQSVAMVSIEFPATGDVITVPSLGQVLVVKFGAPPDTDQVRASFDLDFLAQLISISYQK